MDDEKTLALKFIINECIENLGTNTQVYSYLSKNRHLTDETITKFKLGAFPSSVKRIVSNINPELLKELKIAWVNHYDTTGGICKFRDHYQFITPIYDAFDKPVGISGRYLGPEETRRELGINKYDNSDYPKNTTLFGLNIAKSAIRSKNKALVVEGALDVIKAHQHGIDTVVASAGAFLRLEHIGQLARYTDQIYLGFDNDEAGDKAIERAKKIPHEGVTLTEKRVPKKYKDLDEYLDAKHQTLA